MALLSASCAQKAPSASGQTEDAKAKKPSPDDSGNKPAEAQPRNREQEPDPLSKTAAPQAPIRCEGLDFPPFIKIPEASGATLMGDGTLMVVGDSDTDGVFLILSADDGSVLHKGRLPLDKGASDDLEGLSRLGSELIAITSSGYVRHWQGKGSSFALKQRSYALASKKSGLVCDSPHDTNCAMDYEGLCLLPNATAEQAGCVGFAAAKASGELICLRKDGDRLRLDGEHRIEVSRPKALSGCHFDEKQRLWFGNNVFSINRVGFVEGWQDAATARTTMVGTLGLGISEAIAVAGSDLIYRFSDTTRSPSLLSKHRCR